VARPSRPTPAKRFGQHHLVDAGTLQAILRMAAVSTADVVLEVGAADGLLTVPLAERAAAVHAFEIDRRFASALEALAAAHPAMRLHLCDALRADLGALRPAPTALVSNLPYNIAIPLIVRSLDGLPSLRRWAVMVQKELGERLFAAPGSGAYSAVSVLVQLSCELDARRAVSRTVFSPPPRVDSTFLVFHRRAQPLYDATMDEVRQLVRVSFGQRRKMLATSLAGLDWRGHRLTRDGVRAALAATGLPPGARPQELSPEGFVALTQHLGEA